MENTKTQAKKPDRMFILESMPIPKAILTLAIPTIVANIIQYIYNLTDTFFIGQLKNSYMVAAIGLCMPVTMVLQSFGNMFSIGGASLISRRLGAGLKDGAKHVSSVTFWSAFTVSLVIAAIACMFTRSIVLVCGADADTVDYAARYLLWTMIGAPFITLQMAIGGVLRSEGATNVSTRGMIIGSVINMILDPIFIFTFHLDIVGAAIATTIGNIVGFCINSSYFIGKNSKSVLSISPKMFEFKWEHYSDILKIGLPASFGFFLMSSAQILSNRVASTFGSDLIASNNVVMRVSNIAMMFIMGLTMGSQPLMGYNYGAKRYRRLNQTILFTLLAGTCLNIVLACLMWFASKFWIRVFIDIDAIVTLGSRIMRIMCVSMPFMAIQMTLMTSYQAIGKPLAALIVSLGRQGIFFLPALYTFTHFWGLNGYIWANPFANIFTTLVSIFIFTIVRKSFPSSADESEPAPDSQPQTVLAEKAFADSGSDMQM